MKTFYVLRSIKIRYIILFLILAGLAGWSGTIAFNALSASTSRFTTVFLGIASLAMTLFLGVSALCIGLSLYASQKAELTFDQEFMRFSSVSTRLNKLLPFWLRSFNIRYAYIKWVKRGTIPGLLIITGTNGNSMLFFISAFGKKFGQEILAELKGHLPVECMEKDIELRNKSTKTEILYPTIQIVFSVALLTTIVFDPMFSFSGWYLKDWHVESRFSWLENTATYSVPAADEYWVVTKSFVPQRILHGSHGKVQEWDAPELSADERINFVSGDAYQNPILWLDEKILHFNGQWETIHYQEYANFEMMNYHGRVQGETALVVQNTDNTQRLVRIDALTGMWEEIALPQTAIQQQLSPSRVQFTPNGVFLVLMDSEQASSIFIFTKDGRKSQEYAISNPQGDYPVDIALGVNNAVWILFERHSDYHDYFVMKIDITGESFTTQLPLLPIRDDRPNYENLYIDVHDRIWVYGGYPEFITVFFPVWQGDATRLEHYTQENSNFRSNAIEEPSMSSDGLIWAFDDRITQMNTNLKDLPAPFPIEFGSIKLGVVRLVIFFIYIPFSIYVYYSNRIKSRK